MCRHAHLRQSPSGFSRNLQEAWDHSPRAKEALVAFILLIIGGIAGHLIAGPYGLLIAIILCVVGLVSFMLYAIVVHQSERLPHTCAYLSTYTGVVEGFYMQGTGAVDQKTVGGKEGWRVPPPGRGGSSSLALSSDGKLLGKLVGKKLTVAVLSRHDGEQQDWVGSVEMKLTDPHLLAVGRRGDCGVWCVAADDRDIVLCSYGMHEPPLESQRLGEHGGQRVDAVVLGCRVLFISPRGEPPGRLMEAQCEGGDARPLDVAWNTSPASRVVALDAATVGGCPVAALLIETGGASGDGSVRKWLRIVKAADDQAPPRWEVPVDRRTTQLAVIRAPYDEMENLRVLLTAGKRVVEWRPPRPGAAEAGPGFGGRMRSRLRGSATSIDDVKSPSLGSPGG